MRTIEVYTGQALESVLRDNVKSGQWLVVRFNGFTFKVFGLYCQIMQNPAGLRDSGSMGHRTQKSFIGEILKFVGA